MTIIAFGITGDHMRQKILPAFFTLFAKQQFPTPPKILGISRKKWSDDELRAYVQGVVTQAIQNPEQQTLAEFLGTIEIIEGEADDPAVYEACRLRAEGELLFYLSVAPEFYQPIITHIAEARFNLTSAKIILEKPFGHDLATAQALEDSLEKVFTRGHIYLVDHYLAKPAAQEIARVRADPQVAPFWNRNHITGFTITLLETGGVEDRGAFYDSLGALRDVGQNHLLEMLALLTADGSRAEALADLPALSTADVQDSCIRAQYAGYRDIPGVAKDSETETYFKITFPLASARWAGVIATLESGKRSASARKEIVVSYKDQDPLVISMDQSGGEYEALLRQCFANKQSMFVSYEEVRALWRFVDHIRTAWQKGASPLSSAPVSPDIQ